MSFILDHFSLIFSIVALVISIVVLHSKRK